MPITEAETSTISAYNAIAEARRGSVTTNIDFWRPEFLKLVSGLSRPRLLDLGCGDGRDAALFQSVFGHLDGYIGLDLSQGMLDCAKNRGLTGVSLVGADIYHLPLADHSVDVVWAAASLIHTPRSQISQQLHEVTRCLTKDGRAFFVMKYGEGETWEIGRNPADQRYVVFWQEENFRQALEAAGFEVDSAVVDTTRDNRGVPWLLVTASLRG